MYALVQYDYSPYNTITVTEIQLLRFRLLLPCTRFHSSLPCSAASQVPDTANRTKSVLYFYPISPRLKQNLNASQSYEAAYEHSAPSQRENCQNVWERTLISCKDKNCSSQHLWVVWRHSVLSRLMNCNISCGLCVYRCYTTTEKR